MPQKDPFAGVHIPPMMDEEEIEAVVKVLRSKRLTLLSGKRVKKFEKVFAKYEGTKEAIAVNSGTAALHVALSCLGVGPGDEIIIPPYTFVATATAVLHQNAIPIFADIDPKTYCLNPEAIEEAITPKTKGIMPVHLFGHPADMDPILEIAEKHDLFVIEDACQAHGAEYKGKKVGSIGAFGCFSFFESKNMMTGEGGIITTNDSELADAARMVRHHGEPGWYIYHRLGYNYRMTEVQAALGLVQLSKLDQMNQIRIDYANHYNEHLKDLDGIQVPFVAKDVKHVFHGYAPLLEPEKLNVSKDYFLAKLNEGTPITKRIYPEPLYKAKLFQNRMGYGEMKCPFTCPYYGKDITYDIHLPVVEEMCTRIIGLPNMPTIHKNLLDITIDKIKSVITELKKS
ncbi:MAG: DegT/DnrJ/EryC1/StrS family aminotransferase [Candidatus Helarchaeota archaeon]|nr:DegT/DnrJ/EryC1/StrS family aminotransferase [Candidatus Helarchaeota archaeon]